MGCCPRVCDVLPAASPAPPRLAWSPSCAAQSRDITAGETVTSGGGYPAPGSSGLSPALLPLGSLHGFLCHSGHLTAHLDPPRGPDPRQGTSQVSPSWSGRARGQRAEQGHAAPPYPLCGLGQVTVSCWASTPPLKYRSGWRVRGEQVGSLTQSTWVWVCGRERTSVVCIFRTRPYSPASRVPTSRRCLHHQPVLSGLSRGSKQNTGPPHPPQAVLPGPPQLRK